MFACCTASLNWCCFSNPDFCKCSQKNVVSFSLNSLVSPLFSAYAEISRNFAGMARNPRWLLAIRVFSMFADISRILCESRPRFG